MEAITEELIDNIRAEFNLEGTNNTTEVETTVIENPEKHEESIVPIIPPNSKSLLIDESTSRFSAASWYNAIREKEVTFAGIGGIGSFGVFLLSRLGVKRIIMYDDDTVELSNMSGQLFNEEDIHNFKVYAMSNMLSKYSLYRDCVALNTQYTSNSVPTDIMMCGFDNMSARRLFYYSWQNHVYNKPKEERKNCLYIDGRLAAEEFQVLCIQGDDEYSMGRYEKEFLFSSAEAEATVCSYKQTTFCSNMIGSIMANLFVNFVANSLNPLVPRDLPFYTMYNAETMYFKTIM